MSYCIIHNLMSLNMLLSAEDASKELATELVLADITQEQLFGEFADLWKKYPEVSNFGVWLVHGLASGLQPGERMVSRTETDDDWTSALITQSTSIVNTAPVAPPVRAYRWMADGREIVYHADNMRFKRPSDEFFKDFQEILRKYNITNLGVGPDPMADPLPDGKVYLTRRIGDFRWKTSIEEMPPGAIETRWGISEQTMLSNGQIQAVAGTCRCCHATDIQEEMDEDEVGLMQNWATRLKDWEEMEALHEEM